MSIVMVNDQQLAVSKLSRLQLVILETLNEENDITYGWLVSKVANKYQGKTATYERQLKADIAFYRKMMDDQTAEHVVRYHACCVVGDCENQLSKPNKNYIYRLCPLPGQTSLYLRPSFVVAFSRAIHRLEKRGLVRIYNDCIPDENSRLGYMTVRCVKLTGGHAP